MAVKAPTNPTVVPVNPAQDKYVIQFAPELSNFIRDGEKLRTYRFGDKYAYLKVGDDVELKEYGTGNFTAYAKITSVEKVLFKDVPLNLDQHEYYESKDHQRRVFSSYYKYIGREVEDMDPFLVISYSLK